MRRSAIIGLAVFATIAVATAPAVAQKLAVATYHYDNQRTGWNGHETKLTPANVGSTSFGVLAEVVLDDQVDAQPLVVPNQQITAGPTPGAYQVVYVATEANTIYAIRASNGAVLLAETSELRFQSRLTATTMVRMSELQVLRSSMRRRTHYRSR
jgi:hypothetical protein